MTKQIESVIDIFKKKSASTTDRYLNGDNVIRAINSMLALSNDSSNYNKFIEMASDMIIGLINRIDLTEETIKAFTGLLNDNLYGSASNLQKAILQNVFVEHAKLAWYIRETIGKCIEKPEALRLTKFKAFSILKSLINNGKCLANYDEFVLEMIPPVVGVLSSFGLESLNCKYFSVVLECLMALIKSCKEKYVSYRLISLISLIPLIEIAIGFIE